MTPAQHSVFRAMIISATTRATAMEVKFVTQDGLEVTVIQVNAAASASAILRCLFFVFFDRFSCLVSLSVFNSSPI